MTAEILIIDDNPDINIIKDLIKQSVTKLGLPQIIIEYRDW